MTTDMQRMGASWQLAAGWYLASPDAHRHWPDDLYLALLVIHSAMRYP